MEEKANIDRLVSHVKDYAEERLNLIVLNFHEKVSRILSNTASLLILCLAGLFTILFLSTGLAWWIGLQLQHTFMGFLVVGGIYMLAVILILVNREKWIRVPIINAFLKEVSDEED